MYKRKIYLKMKINSTKREKNTATLSIVLNITNNCLLKFGINRTSFKIRSNLKVLKTLNPEFVSRPPKPA